MMYTVTIVRVIMRMIAVVMARLLMIVILVDVLASLFGLNVYMGNVIVGMAMADSKAEPRCSR